MHRGGYFRHKISSRIEERRARRRRTDSDEREESASSSGTNLSSSFAGGATSFSGLLRQTSDHDFLLVEDEERPPRRSQSLREDVSGGHSIAAGRPLARGGAIGSDSEEDNHAALEQGGQRRTGSEEPISEKDLENLVDMSEDEEDGGLLAKPSTTECSNAGEEVKKKEEHGKKIWEVTDSSVYEQQLELLQEQLTSALIDNQALKKDSIELERANTELVSLRRQNTVLSHRLSSASSSVDLDSQQSPKLELASGSGGARRRGTGNNGSYGGSVLSSTEEDGFQSVTVSPDVRVVQRREQQRAKKKSIFSSVMEWVYDFIADFTEEQCTEEEEDKEDPLTSKKLKTNLQRLAKTSRPWTDFGFYLQSILQWRNTAETLVVFLIYMYCVWSGWVLSMLLFLAVLSFTLTYLRTSGLADQFGLNWKYTSSMKTPIEELGFGDKLQLVKGVAQTCQNKSKFVADSLEKAQNLFLWHQPAATKIIYRNIIVFFVASLLLPNSYLLTVIGLFVGVKLFIIDNIYRKYPKVKERYDGIAKIWKSLPTDAQLLERQALLQEQLNRQSLGVADSEGNTSSQLTEEQMAFCTRFRVSPDELPLPSWLTGKRCSILDKDKPLTLRRNGRLYLTQTYLCFERNTKPVDPDRFTLSLNKVLRVCKAKPFAVLPGSGMSIEVTLNSGTKYLFSAIINRDQAYCSILDQGFILGLPWGTEVGDREDSITMKEVEKEVKSTDKDKEIVL